jgi:hypothetical protein
MEMGGALPACQGIWNLWYNCWGRDDKILRGRDLTGVTGWWRIDLTFKQDMIKESDSSNSDGQQ